MTLAPFNTNANTPAPSVPMIDLATGLVVPAWFQFFLSLYGRTGSGPGVNATVVLAAATAATAAAALATTAAAAANSAAAAANSAVGAEAATRAAADLLLAPLISPTFTGLPRGPTVASTAAAGTTQLATTAFARNGTTTNDNGLAGQVGEFIFSEVLAAAGVALTSGVAADVTAISLTPGDWDVTGSLYFAPAATTVMQTLSAWSSSTSATIPTGTIAGYNSAAEAFPANIFQLLPLPMHRFSLVTTTTVFLSASAMFTTSTLKGSGYIEARRMR